MAIEDGAVARLLPADCLSIQEVGATGKLAHLYTTTTNQQTGGNRPGVNLMVKACTGYHLWRFMLRSFPVKCAAAVNPQEREVYWAAVEPYATRR